VSLVYGEAVSGGFLSFGLMADEIFALPDAQVRVMNLKAMARVTKKPIERLEALSRTSPVFAPGVENYAAMGAVNAVWADNVAERLVAALRERAQGDRRRQLGRDRGGRMLAADIAHRVADGVA
jgi:malonate decarboxylase gamma subunit